MSVKTVADLTAAEYMRDPQAFRQVAVAEMMPAAAQAVVRALRGDPPFKQPQRWAVRIAMQVAGWLDMRSEVAVVLKLAQDYGLRNESDIRAKLELATRVKVVSLEVGKARAIELLRRVMAADPSTRESVKAELFGPDNSGDAGILLSASHAEPLPDNEL